MASSLSRMPSSRDLRSTCERDDHPSPTALGTVKPAGPLLMSAFDLDDIVSIDTQEPGQASDTAAQGQFPRSSRWSPRVLHRVSLACIPCRARHHKCDAIKPVCSRCRQEQEHCSYAKSRRGHRTTKTCGGAAEHDVDAPTRTLSRSVGTPLSLPLTDASIAFDDLGSGYSFYGCPVEDGQSSTLPPSRQAPWSKWMDLYYTHFHSAHPFALPRQHLRHRLQTRKETLRDLIPVMEYIGSHYNSAAPRSGLGIRAKRVLHSHPLSMMAAGKMPGHPGFAVQALLFLAIAVHCNDDFDEARSILNQAIEIALHIGMQSRTYSAAFGEGSRVLEESWRRTWWGLYVTDGVFAGIRHRPTFSLWTVETDVELPCEESHYEAGEIPPPQTLQDYDSREFSADDTAFSSFTYLIDLGSIIGAVLAVGTDPGEPFDSSVVSADANLINWAMYHPKSKRDLIGEDGKLDEVLFQAHALFNTFGHYFSCRRTSKLTLGDMSSLKVYLHRPRSLLAYDGIECVSRCAPPPDSERLTTDRRPLYDIHTTKALEAAQAGLGLFTLPGPFIMHTPLVLCGLTLSMLAQISACTYVLSGMEYSKARDRVRLGLGVVKAFAEVWPLGGKAVNEVRTIATAVLSTQTVSPSSFRDVQCPRPATLDVPSDSPDRSGEGLDLDDPDLLRLSWDSAMAACLEESLPEYK